MVVETFGKAEPGYIEHQCKKMKKGDTFLYSIRDEYGTIVERGEIRYDGNGNLKRIEDQSSKSK